MNGIIHLVLDNKSTVIVDVTDQDVNFQTLKNNLSFAVKEGEVFTFWDERGQLNGVNTRFVRRIYYWFPEEK
jgi:hypothetical protein